MFPYCQISPQNLWNLTCVQTKMCSKFNKSLKVFTHIYQGPVSLTLTGLSLRSRSWYLIKLLQRLPSLKREHWVPLQATSIIILTHGHFRQQWTNNVTHIVQLQSISIQDGMGQGWPYIVTTRKQGTLYFNLDAYITLSFMENHRAWPVKP